MAKKAIFFVLALAVGLFLPSSQAAFGGYMGVPWLPGSVVTGFTTLNVDTNKGDHNVLSVNPILLVPVGEGLISGELEGGLDLFNITKTEWPELEYFKFQYPLGDHLMVDVGRSLVPFGDWNERYHPSWIQKVRQSPMISELLPGHSGNGFQLRGGYPYFLGGERVALNYTLYHFLGAKGNTWLASKEGTGGRFSVFLPQKQLEVGLSGYWAHGRHSSLFGTHVNWQPDMYTTVRGEFTNAENARGFWALASRDLGKHFPNTPIVKSSELVFRAEHLWVDSESNGNHEEEGEDDHDGDGMGESEEMSKAEDGDHDEEGEEAGHDEGEEGEVGHSEGEKGHGHGELPEVDTTRLTVGWNYYPPFAPGARFMFSYSQTIADENAGGKFGVAVSYRF